MSWVNEFGLYIIGLLIIFIIIILVINFIKSNKINELENIDVNVEKMLNSINPSKNLDSNLTEFLSILPSIIGAPSYAFYILDDKNNTYILKAVRQIMNDNPTISPSYSGLLPYKKENFFMPATVNNEGIPEKICLLKQGEVPLVYLPFENQKGLIMLGPVSKISLKEQNQLQQFCNKMEPILECLLKTEEIKNKMNLMSSSGKAVKNISSFFSDIKSMLNIILEVAIRSINANGALFILEEQGKMEVETIIGFESNIEEQFIKDLKTQTLFFELLGDSEFVLLNKDNKDYFRIPPYFVAAEAEVILLVKVKSEKGVGLAAFWYSDNINVKDYQITAIKILSKRISDILNNHTNFQKIAYSYVDILRTLAKLIDNLSKYTVSYSELMYRYAVIICKEMKLSKEETRDIALAAYLSNIGVIGLSDQLLTKKGKYSEVEYEMMKLHADSGASIIEATIGNAKVASYIRYHHERIDGYGYPEQLKGDEIPLGARIIAVLQTFLAKILSRDYRKALPFDQALKQLKTAGGTQLDAEVVDVLVNWFEKKRLMNKNRNCALGNCWDMRCSPESICIKCPAYKDTSKNCWEHKDVNCEEHGNNCDNCYIYTEYLGRMTLK